MLLLLSSYTKWPSNCFVSICMCMSIVCRLSILEMIYVLFKSSKHKPFQMVLRTLASYDRQAGAYFDNNSPLPACLPACFDDSLPFFMTLFIWMSVMSTFHDYGTKCQDFQLNEFCSSTVLCSFHPCMACRRILANILNWRESIFTSFSSGRNWTKRSPLQPPKEQEEEDEQERQGRDKRKLNHFNSTTTLSAL